ncbi:MAG: DegT/DnrJ/EryC1/StrS family aminotransferase [Arsenophonus sp.]
MIPLLGYVAHPMRIDVDRRTLMAQIDVVESPIISKTKAIITVHYALAPYDLNALPEIAQRKNIALIENVAHAINTQY